MKTIRIIFAALALLASLGQAATSAQYWQTTQITSGHTWFTGSPKVWGDEIYWTDWRSGGAEVYVRDASGTERRLVGDDDGDSGTGYAIAGVYEDRQVVLHYTNSQYNLYLRDAAGEMHPISLASGNQKNADIHGQTVVYESYETGVSQVWMWDPANGARAISPSSYWQQFPRIWGDSVVWQDGRNGRWDVYMWNPRDGERRLSTYIYGMDYPDIYEDRVVMSVHQQYPMYDPFGIWEWRAGQGLVGPLVEYKEAYFNRMSGNLIAWGVGPGMPAGAVMAYHPGTGLVRLTQNGRSHDVYGNKVVWVSDTYDVWMAELVPEPSSFLALGGGCVGLLGLLRRRRRSAR